MGSLARTYSQEKLFGQIYTPSFIVCKILDDVGYNSPDILGKKIIDPACGDGRFLVEAVKRIVAFSPKNCLKENLERVYGWDIDENALIACRENLNNEIKGKGINIQWNVETADSIERYRKKDLFSDSTHPQFDFIVGNPPYIRIQHLDAMQRKHIQENYNFCKSGSTDIYIAFYELCVNLLSDDGICGLITPNTFLFTETARALRIFFAANKNIIQITNYGDVQLFDGTTTYSAITVFNKQKNQRIRFQKAISETMFEERNINVAELQEPFWQLTTDGAVTVRGKKLKELCDIHVGITTLCDKAYIFSVEPLDEEYVLADTKFLGKVKLERNILKPIVKGSRLKRSDEKIKEYVLFPYRQCNGKHGIIAETALKKEYPLAYDYLLSVKSELDKRDNGKPNQAAWYAFGRSQGLDTSFGEKIIFSPMNEKPNFIYYPNPKCTFYSGYCIKNLKGVSVEQLLVQLNSERMDNFVSMSSRDFRGGWKAYNKKIIENFEVVI